MAVGATPGRRSRRTPVLWCAALAVLGAPALLRGEVPDKTGVAPTVISLPTGPGTVDGLGESFQPRLNTGSARYAVPIALPAGTGGTPSVRLSYDAGFGEGPAGMGWRYVPGAISRRTEKGLPRYVDGPNGVDDDLDGFVDETDEQDAILGPDGEELADLGDGTWRARIEGAFTRYRRTGDHWEADLAGGARLVYGASAAARVADPSGGRVFRWLLERSTDANGNVTEYRWASLPGSGAQKYLEEVRYGAGAPPWSVFFFARFEYEGRPDRVEDCHAGFTIVTASRLARIAAGVQGVPAPGCAPGDYNGDGQADALVGRYIIEYDATHPRHSLLAKITRYGADGASWLPPLSLGYAAFEPPRTISAAGAVAGSVNAPPVVMDGGLAELVDLNRDGLADILRTDLWGGQHTAYLNLGESVQGDGTAVRWDEGRPMGSDDGLALSLQLVQDRVSLADMDGDGIADLVHFTPGGEVQYYPNLGSAAWGARVRLAPVAEAPPAPYALPGVQTSDLDFDKRTDVLMSTDVGYSAWFNLGDGRFSGEVRTPGARWQGHVIQFSESGVQLADVNGDRLNDVVRVTPTLVIWAASLGRGEFGETVEVAIPGAVLTDGKDGQVKRARLADIDGDGLADLVVDRAVPGELWLWLNQGNGTFSPRTVVGDLPASQGVGAVVRWADLNGNGTTDLVWADSTAEPRLRFLDIGRLAGGSSHPNLLTTIDNGLGVTTTIDYATSTDLYLADALAGHPWTLTVPFPVQVVSRVQTASALDLDPVPGADTTVQEYRYRDGFYEDREKAFRGFARVDVTEPGDPTAPTRVGRHRFFTGGPDGADNDGDGLVDEVSPEGHREEEALKGMVISTEVRSAAGTVFSREENYWAVRTLLSTPGGIEVRWAYNGARDRVLVEGTATPETLRTAWEYDGFGHATEERNQGALSIAGDEVFTFTDFVNNTSRWVLGRPWRSRVTNAAGDTLAETYSFYDGEAYVGLPAGSVERGNLTRRTGWVGGDEFVDLERNARDAWGNVVGLLDPNGNLRSIAYDSLTHRFPVGERVVVGGGMPDLLAGAAYHAGLGTVLSFTGFDGQTTSYGHDVFGRLTSVVEPGDTPDRPTRQYIHTLADPAHGLTYAYDAAGNLSLVAGPATANAVATRAREVSGAAGTYDEVRYSDGRGRALAGVAEAESGFVVAGAVTFNALGSAHRAFRPYASATGAYARPSLAEPAGEVRYDAAGREVLRVNPPDAAAALTQVATDYAPLRTTVTDEDLEKTTAVSDGQGRVIEVRRSDGAATRTTRHGYDPLGRLTLTTDALGNSWERFHDGLGRLVRVEDPDRGRSDYRYDAAGNLVSATDNKGQSTLYEYDGAGRVRAEYRVDGGEPVRVVAYHYDAPAPDYPGAAGTAGRLAWVEDQSGAHFFSYDARGNVAWQVVRVADEGLTRDYLVRKSYDAMGRAVASVFPDGDRVTYAYNAGSRLESIPRVVDGIDYHPSGAIERIVYGNGVATGYAFDPRDRMVGLSSDPPLPGAPLQRLTYTLDGVGNVTAIGDGRGLAPMDPAFAGQSFLYDHLHRLTHAEGPGYGAVDFAYDAIGNLVSAASPAAPSPQHIADPLVNLGAIAHGGGAGSAGRGRRAAGDPPGPHAVTSTASGLAFGYDANGNMIASGADSYEWDHKDRLARAVTAAADTRYTYDYKGRRVVKRVLEGGATRRTEYVDPTYEVRDGKPVKHVFAGGRRVARVEGRLADSATAQTLSFAPGWNFFSLTVEPGNAAVAAVLSPIAGIYTGVWAYDAAAGSYVGYVPAQGTTDLAELHTGRGYLILVTVACELAVSGAAPSGSAVLPAGWSLAACPAENALSVEEAFGAALGQVEAVWGRDPVSGDWSLWMPSRPAFVEPLAYLEPGRSYWVRLAGAATVPWQSRPTRITWYHPDHLGSSSLVTDESGAEVGRTEFYPYGRVRYQQGPGSTPEYRFTGKERDAETGLDYFGARYYNPVIGAFASTDPAEAAIGVPADLNRYAYARANPLLYTDPDGRTVHYDLDVHVLEPRSPEQLRRETFEDVIWEEPSAQDEDPGNEQEDASRRNTRSASAVAEGRRQERPNAPKSPLMKPEVEAALSRAEKVGPVIQRSGPERTDLATPLPTSGILGPASGSTNAEDVYERMADTTASRTSRGAAAGLLNTAAEAPDKIKAGKTFEEAFESIYPEKERKRNEFKDMYRVMFQSIVEFH